jgi:multiple sugar transport system substrate-binding protein
VVCADGDDQLLWLEGADVRHAAFAGGTDHASFLRGLAGRFGQATGLTVGVHSGNFYSSPVPGGLVGPLTGEPPADVVTAFVGGRLRACVERGLLAPLDDLWEQRGWADRLAPAVVDLATVDGHRAFAPTTVQWNPVFYRTDLFADAGVVPPTTWDELLALCDAFAADGRAAFASAGAWSPPTARYFTILDLRLNGADFHQRLLWGQESWHDPRVAAVLDHWEQMIDRDCFVEDPASTDFRGAVEDLETGRAAMWNIGEWLHEFVDPALHDRLDFFAFPTLDASVPPAEIALVQGVAVRAGAAAPAVELAAFLTSEEVLRDQYEALTRVVVDPGVDLPYTGTRARAHTFLDGAADLVPLLEFSTEPVHAGTVLAGLVRFSRDPTERVDVLADLEASRLDRFAP